MENKEYESKNFIEEIIEEDLKSGKHGGRVHTRFPPEPNGYLHIGHAKAICLNFGLAEKYNGKTNLRFDDTNPATEETEYVEAIKQDIKWLGYDWEDREYFASDYFPKLYAFAHTLIDKDLAYVDDLTPEQMADQKGTPTSAGVNSPNRDRSVEENKQLFTEMKEGKHADGSLVLRAKIDMASPNMLMRDPILYRIKRETHHRTGDDWCIYPMYDFAHGQSDSIEEITHSLCSLEFRHHRDLYDWLIQSLEIFPSMQREFSRMNVEYMITSKRKLLKLVTEGHVSGWDDPRMPTLSGLRKKGYPPAAIRNFIEKVGMTKRENLIDLSLLEFCVREELNKIADRVNVVLDPLKVVITNYPEGQTETLKALNNPEEETPSYRELTFGKEIYIDRKDFMIDPPKKYFRMAPERNVRLKYAYILNCEKYITDDHGTVTEVHCSYYPNTKSGEDNSGIKAKGTLHWVAAEGSIPAKVNLYDNLFTDPTPDGHEDKDYLEFLNPESLKIVSGALAESSLASATPGSVFQFMRTGYFVVDESSTPENLVFNRTVSLKDSWAKKQAKKS
jgi:glutaminyl-tRNA synthetase